MQAFDLFMLATLLGCGTWLYGPSRLRVRAGQERFWGVKSALSGGSSRLRANRATHGLARRSDAGV